MATPSFEINVFAHDEQVRRDLAYLEKRVHPNIMANALNAARTSILRRAYANIAGRHGITVDLVRNRYDRAGNKTGPRIRYRRASNKRDFTDWDWLPKQRPGQVAMWQVSGVAWDRSKGGGVTAGAHHRKGAFIAPAPDGQRLVFRRKGDARKPIIAQRIALNPHADNTMRRMLRVGGIVFQKEMKAQLDKRLRGRRR